MIRYLNRVFLIFDEENKEGNLENTRMIYLLIKNDFKKTPMI